MQAVDPLNYLGKRNLNHGSFSQHNLEGNSTYDVHIASLFQLLKPNCNYCPNTKTNSTSNGSSSSSSSTNYNRSTRILHRKSFQQLGKKETILAIVFMLLGPQYVDQNATSTRSSWRIRLAELIDSLPIHLATMVLILLELILPVLDISSTLLSCTDSSNKREQSKMYHWAGIAILGVLFAKVMALAIAIGSSFFTSPGHVIDGIVMAGAPVLEAVAEGKGAGLLVVVSLWRVVRVVESAFELSNEAIEAQIEGIVLKFDVLQAENQRLEEIVVEKDKRIKLLEEDCLV